MARPSGPKIRCSGLWTEAEFKSFIQRNLRSATRKWKPISDCLKRARIARGLYRCEGCNSEVTATVVNDNGKRVKGIVVDHIKPIVDPDLGFTNWDDYINGMFCEADNLQALCHKCHDSKTQQEREQHAIRRKKGKDDVSYI